MTEHLPYGEPFEGGGRKDVERYNGESVTLYGHAGRWRTRCGAEFRYRADATSHAASKTNGSCGGTRETCPTKGVGHN